MSVREKPMHILCSFIGVAPYTFDPKSSNLKFKTSICASIYSLLIIIVLLAIAVVNYQTMEVNLRSESRVTLGAQWLQFYTNNGFSVVIVIVNTLQQWKIVKVFNEIFKTEYRLQNLSDDKESRKEIFCGTLAMVIAVFLHLLITLTSYFDNQKRIDYYWFAYGILFLLNSMIIVQFLFVVVKVGIKFRDLSSRLLDCTQSEQPLFTLKSKQTNESSIHLAVEKIAEAHLNLINSTDLLISAFSYQLLICFITGLIISVTGSYLICKRIIQYSFELSDLHNFQGELERDYDWWALSCYPLVHSILLGLIIAVCHWTVSQSKLLDDIAPRVQRSSHLLEKSSINALCQQLLLRQLSFGVLQLFTINPSMVFSIISTVLTYLIILLQFELSQVPEVTAARDVLNSVAIHFRNDTSAYNFTGNDFNVSMMYAYPDEDVWRV